MAEQSVTSMGPVKTRSQWAKKAVPIAKETVTSSQPHATGGNHPAFTTPPTAIAEGAQRLATIAASPTTIVVRTLCMMATRRASAPFSSAIRIIGVEAPGAIPQTPVAPGNKPERISTKPMAVVPRTTPTSPNSSSGQSRARSLRIVGGMVLAIMKPTTPCTVMTRRVGIRMRPSAVATTMAASMAPIMIPPGSLSASRIAMRTTDSATSASHWVPWEREPKRTEPSWSRAAKRRNSRSRGSGSLWAMCLSRDARGSRNHAMSGGPAGAVNAGPFLRPLLRWGGGSRSRHGVVSTWRGAGWRIRTLDYVAESGLRQGELGGASPCSLIDWAPSLQELLTASRAATAEPAARAPAPALLAGLLFPERQTKRWYSLAKGVIGRHLLGNAI